MSDENTDATGLGDALSQSNLDLEGARRELDILRGRNVVHKDELREKRDFYREMAEKVGPEEFTIAYTRMADDLEELIGDE